MHRAMAAALDCALDEIATIQRRARSGGRSERPRWPMIVLRSPKGWTGPEFVDGLPTEGSFRSHQVPLAGMRTNPAHLQQLEDWMRSYRPEELFDEDGAVISEIRELAPVGPRRMSANPHANGGAPDAGTGASRLSRLRASRSRAPPPTAARRRGSWAPGCAT